MREEVLDRVANMLLAPYPIGPENVDEELVGFEEQLRLRSSVTPLLRPWWVLCEWAGRPKVSQRFLQRHLKQDSLHLRELTEHILRTIAACDRSKQECLRGLDRDAIFHQKVETLKEVYPKLLLIHTGVASDQLDERLDKLHQIYINAWPKREAKRRAPDLEGLKELFGLLPQIELQLKIVQMEEQVGIRIPWAALSGLVADYLEDQEISDEGALATWVAALNSSRIPISLLHEVLGDLVALMPISREYKVWQVLAALECALEEQLQCEIFQQEDPIHVAWLESLGPGSVLSWGEHEYQLGERVPGQSCAFEIENDSRHLLFLSPRNRTRAGIEERREARRIPELELTYASGGIVHPDGIAILRQRLLCLATKWCRADRGEKEESDFCRTFTAQFRRIIERGIAPKWDFRDAVWVTEQGEVVWVLKSSATEPLVPGLFEQFFHRVAHGRPDLFRHLMTETGLVDCVAAKMARKRMVAALRAADAEKAPDRDSYYQLMSHVRDAVERLADEYDALTEVDARQLVLDEIADVLTAACCVIRAPEGLANDLVTAVVDTQQL